MKCYFGGSSKPFDFDHVEVCFARSAKEAKAFMWKHSHRLGEECEHDYFMLRVFYRPDHNGLWDKEKTAPYIVENDADLRKMGWSMEGDEQCCHCGGASFEDQFPVCESCGSCKECDNCDDCR